MTKKHHLGPLNDLRILGVMGSHKYTPGSLGELPGIYLESSKFSKIYVIIENTCQDTIGWDFILRGGEI